MHTPYAFTCRQKQQIGYLVADLLLLVLLLLLILGDYGLLILMAYNLTTVTPTPKVTMEH